MQKGKRTKNRKENFQDLWDNYKMYICVIRLVKGKIREQKKIFEVIMAENCSKFIRDTKNHISGKIRFNKGQGSKNIIHISYSNDWKSKTKRESWRR